MAQHERKPSINQAALQQASQGPAHGSCGLGPGHLLWETDLPAEDSIAFMNNVPARDHRAWQFDHAVNAADPVPRRRQGSPVATRSEQAASALSRPNESRRMQRMVVWATWSSLIALVVTFWIFAIIGVVHTVGLLAY